MPHTISENEIRTEHTGKVVKVSRDSCSIIHPGVGTLQFYPGDCTVKPFGDSRMNGLTVKYTLVQDGQNYRITNVRSTRRP